MPLFPLAGAILFPRAQLPLHIFEERYKAMIARCLEEEIEFLGPVRLRDVETAQVMIVGKVRQLEEMGVGQVSYPRLLTTAALTPMPKNSTTGSR